MRAVEWGHDFRSAFKSLSYFRQTFPSVPITAVTATATARVRKDILDIMHMKPEPELKLFLLATSRKNLHYEIR